MDWWQFSKRLNDRHYCYRRTIFRMVSSSEGFYCHIAHTAVSFPAYDMLQQGLQIAIPSSCVKFWWNVTKNQGGCGKLKLNNGLTYFLRYEFYVWLTMSMEFDHIVIISSSTSSNCLLSILWSLNQSVTHIHISVLLDMDYSGTWQCGST